MCTFALVSHVFISSSVRPATVSRVPVHPFVFDHRDRGKAGVVGLILRLVFVYRGHEHIHTGKAWLEDNDESRGGESPTTLLINEELLSYF